MKTPLNLRFASPFFVVIACAALSSCGGAGPEKLSVSLNYQTKSSYSVWDSVSVSPTIIGLEGQTPRCSSSSSNYPNPSYVPGAPTTVPVPSGLNSIYNPSNSATTFSVGSLPLGFTLDPATCVITGQAEMIGTYSLSVSMAVSGYTGFLSATAPIVVTGPTLEYRFAKATVGKSLVQWGDPLPVEAGTPILTGIVPTTDTISYRAAGLLPPGISLDPSTGALSGVPSSTGASKLLISATIKRGDRTVSVLSKTSDFWVDYPTFSYTGASVLASDNTSVTMPIWDGLRQGDVLTEYYPSASASCPIKVSATNVPFSDQFTVDVITGAARPKTPIVGNSYCTGISASVIRNGVQKTISAVLTTKAL